MNPMMIPIAMHESFDENSLEFYKISQKLITEKETWKSEVTHAITNDGLEKFQRIFSAEEQEFIENHLDWSTFSPLVAYGKS